MTESIDQAILSELLKAYADHMYDKRELKADCFAEVAAVVSEMMDRGLCTQQMLRDLEVYVKRKTHVKPSKESLFHSKLTRNIITAIGNNPSTLGCSTPAIANEDLSGSLASFLGYAESRTPDEDIVAHIAALKHVAPTTTVCQDKLSNSLSEHIEGQLSEIKRQFSKAFDADFLENF